MPTTTKRLFLLTVVGAVVGCTITDAPSTSSTAQTSTSNAASAASVQISGLSNFQQTAQVLTTYCSNVKFDTDRRAVAQSAIDKALNSYGTALPGGLRVDIQSLSIRLRCHSAGPSGFGSYCAADTKLALTASGRDRGGQEVNVAASKDVTERRDALIFCNNAMAAVTSAVDKVLTEALVDLQTGLTTRTGIAP